MDFAFVLISDDKAADHSWTPCSKLEETKEGHAATLLKQAVELRDKADRLVAELATGGPPLPIQPAQEVSPGPPVLDFQEAHS